jgi:hypothetical protein
LFLDTKNALFPKCLSFALAAAAAV